MGRRAGIGGGMLLGVGIGGFFDGILLHQILQWHHLLSLVPGLDDLRLQVLWDGVFHLAMYGVALAGAIGLWRRRNVLDGRGLAGAVLIGFGLWHLLDAVLSHWLLGLHRIRLDTAHPLAWDLGWLALFGLAPMLAGALMRAGGDGPGRAVPRTALLLLLLASATAGAATLPPAPGAEGFATIVFRPGVRPAAAMEALAASGARLVWSDPAMGVVLAELRGGDRWRLYRHGALLVTGGAVPAGCLGWSRPA